MIAVCPKCGNVFDFAGINFEGAAFVSFKGNKTRCPNCGSTADIEDFEIHNGVITYLTRPEFTPEILEKFKALTEKAISEEYTADRFKEEAKEFVPFYSRFEKYIPTERISVFLGILITIIIFLIDRGKKEQVPVVQQTVINNYAAPAKSSSLQKPNKKRIKKTGYNKPARFKKKKKR